MYREVKDLINYRANSATGSITYQNLIHGIKKNVSIFRSRHIFPALYLPHLSKGHRCRTAQRGDISTG